MIDSFMKYLTQNEFMNYERERHEIMLNLNDIDKKYNDIVVNRITEDAKIKFLKRIKEDPSLTDAVLWEAYCLGLIQQDLIDAIRGDGIITDIRGNERMY